LNLEPTFHITDDQRLRPAKSEVFRLCGDNTLITNLTSWRPGITLEQGLQETIAWFTRPENLAKYKTGVYNV
jgi:nucleoside-diphosphate-sugar epimerase